MKKEKPTQKKTQRTAKKKLRKATKKSTSVKSKKKKTSSRKKALSRKTLVIVESPAKAKTIHKYLGKDFVIEASIGHIIDLPRSRLAVNVQDNFQPEYITVRGRAPILNRLKTLAASVKDVLLAADPDREGEAISWHLKRVLSLKNPNIMRIEFNEITKTALQEALKKPRDINQDLVNAQQARRILDRLVGYSISPLLWQKIKRGLSAGRVQSVALKYVCEREAEITKFKPQEYWSLTADLNAEKVKFQAELYSIDGKRLERTICSEEEMNQIVREIESEKFIVKSVSRREVQKEPSAPYTTSKLQQEASGRLHYPSQKTMMIAQQLYEGQDIGERGVMGLITYMRTDSCRISPLAIEKGRSLIQSKYGDEYLPSSPRIYKNKRQAQDAHEAIRPSEPDITPELTEPFLTKDQQKLYSLIWEKFISSQMANEISMQTSVQVECGNKIFRTGSQEIKFHGFSLVWKKAEKQKTIALKNITKGAICSLKKLEPKQHFTQPPPRYNDASMVKVLEESGIGRPSTYAPTIQTLLKRYYATRIQRALQPTELGMIVHQVMSKYFSSLIDTDFTADMETKLDQIALSELHWVEMLRSFYDPFVGTVKEASEKMEDMKSLLDQPTDYVCEKCGTKMVKKLGRNGYFLACPRFPECKNAQSIPLGPCPKCETGQVVRRSTKRKRPFYACNCYPECEFSTWYTPAEEQLCPQCKKLLFTKQASPREPQKSQICLSCAPESKESQESSSIKSIG